MRSIPFMFSAFIGAVWLSSSSFATEPTSALLQDNFDGRDFSETGGLYYRQNKEQKAGTYTFQSKEKLDGQGALKLSVQELCKSEERKCSERAEIWEKTALRVPYSKGVWYGFSVKFADPIPTNRHRYVIAQWKREIGPEAKGDFSPFLALRMNKGKLFATTESNFHPAPQSNTSDRLTSCGDANAKMWLRPESDQMRGLIAFDKHYSADDGKLFSACSDKIKISTYGNNLPSPFSGWITFAIYSKPGADGTGHIEMFANGDHIVTAKGAIGHNNHGLGDNQYFKFGPYRDSAAVEWTLYFDNFVRSENCMDVLKDLKACQTIKYH